MPSHFRCRIYFTFTHLYGKSCFLAMIAPIQSNLEGKTWLVSLCRRLFCTKENSIDVTIGRSNRNRESQLGLLSNIFKIFAYILTPSPWCKLRQRQPRWIVQRKHHPLTDWHSRGVFGHSPHASTDFGSSYSFYCRLSRYHVPLSLQCPEMLEISTVLAA